MTDPLRAPGKTSRRAEPLQPDRPGRGDDQFGLGDDPGSRQATSDHEDPLEKQLEQTETALDNVRHP